MRLLSILLFLSAIVMAAFNGCKPMPNDGVPFYVKIDSVKVTVDNPITQGLNTQNVSDVWVETGAYNLGAFEIPTKFPVLLKGDLTFVVSAGVKTNGAANNRLIYPMYSPDTFSINPTLDTIYRRTPNFKYKTGVSFPILENFDVSNGFDGMGVEADSGYGARCGLITVLPTDSAKEATAKDKFQAVAGDEIWLELDYKSSVPFYVGFYANYTAATPARVPLVFVNERDHWNKIYIKLSDAVAYYLGDAGYNLYFEALKPADNSAGGKVYIDNVKVLKL